MPLSRAEAALVEARVRTNEWVAAQKADRSSEAKRRRLWRIVVLVCCCISLFLAGYLIGVQGKRAIGVAALAGLSGLAAALVWGTWEIERDEEQ